MLSDIVHELPDHRRTFRWKAVRQWFTNVHMYAAFRIDNARHDTFDAPQIALLIRAAG